MGMIGMMLGMGNPVVSVPKGKNQNEKTTRTIRQSSSVNRKKYKSLKYNFKEISGQILLANTSGIAGAVMVRARVKVVQIQGKQGNPDYDRTELYHALVHAKKMVRIAKKKMKHLKEEEQAGKCGTATEELSRQEAEEENKTQQAEQDRQLAQHRRELQKLQEEYQKLMQETMEEVIEDTQELDGLEDDMCAVQVDLSPEELERLRKKHRADELREIVEADMKYLKSMMEKLQREKQEGAGAVSLQLSGAQMSASPVVTDMPVPAETDGASSVQAGAGIDISL